MCKYCWEQMQHNRFGGYLRYMDMKKLIWSATIIIGAMCIFRLGMVAGAASSEPGSSGDPLITKSYLEARIKDVNQGSLGAYEKVTVNKGKTVTVSTGGELLLYSGSGKVTGKSGLLNLSTGQIFKSGNTAVKYNPYLVVEKGGMKALSSSVVYIKGAYSIK